MIVAVLALGVTQAQTFQTGPKAKNAKVWNSNQKTVPIAFQSSPETVTGAEAKRFKTWNSESSKLLIQTRREIDNPKGLNAKNRKVWEESSRMNVNSNASYVLPKPMKKKRFWWH